MFDERRRVQNARDGLRPSREPRTGRSLIAARVTRRMGWPKPRGTHGSTRTFGRQVAWRGAGRPNLRVAFGPCRSVRRGEGGSCALRRFFPSPRPSRARRRCLATRFKPKTVCVRSSKAAVGATRARLAWGPSCRSPHASEMSWPVVACSLRLRLKQPANHNLTARSPCSATCPNAALRMAVLSDSIAGPPGPSILTLRGQCWPPLMTLSRAQLS